MSSGRVGVQAPLMPAEQQQVAAALRAHAGLLASCGLSPELLPGLVEHNPGIALEAVLQLLPTQQVRPSIYVSHVKADPCR